MTVQDQTDGAQQSADDSTKTLSELQASYDKLQAAHNKLKEDHTNLKSTVGDVASLQKQIDGHIKDKSKLIKEQEELQETFSVFKKDIQSKEVKQHLTTALEAAGARNSATAMKLVDMNAIKFDENGQVVQTSVADAVNAVKTSDSTLFREEGEAPKGTTSTPTTAGPALPVVAHAVTNVTKSAYEVEMAAAVASKDPKRVDAVFEAHRRV